MRFLLFILVVFSLFCSAQSWGKFGHEAVANIAWNRLDSHFKTRIIQILGTSNATVGSPLAYVADWADRVRYTHYYSWTSPLHFIDVRDDVIAGGCPAKNETSTTMQEEETCSFVYERDCENDYCVAGAIANYSNHLSSATQRGVGGSLLLLRGGDTNNDAAAWRIKEALMFVTHFVGDIHQPLHCARKTDKGGNTIHVSFNATSFSTSNINSFKHKKGEWNLHSVWDDGIIERALVELYNHSRQAFEADLEKLIKEEEHAAVQEWLSCADGRNKTCTTIWGKESLEDALEWAYLNTDGNEVVNGSEISERYYETRLAVVQRRLAAAGVRLAATLEMVLADKSKRTFGDLLFRFIRQALS